MYPDRPSSVRPSSRSIPPNCESKERKSTLWSVVSVVVGRLGSARVGVRTVGAAVGFVLSDKRHSQHFTPKSRYFPQREARLNKWNEHCVARRVRGMNKYRFGGIHAESDTDSDVIVVAVVARMETLYVSSRKRSTGRRRTRASR
jgi:pyruvoyl-dependent arginine decarboxylase (PvlArgDC)